MEVNPEQFSIPELKNMALADTLDKTVNNMIWRPLPRQFVGVLPGAQENNGG